MEIITNQGSEPAVSPDGTVYFEEITLDPGENEIRVRVVDNNGNFNEATTSTFYDNGYPSITIQSVNNPNFLTDGPGIYRTNQDYID